jgi:hypothetical protein
MRDGGYGSNRFVCTSVILNSVARGLAHIRSMGGESGPLGRPVGNALPQHLVVDALKDFADPKLILTAEASPGLSNLRVGRHGRL